MYRIFLQETYELEDNYWYDDATSDKSSKYGTSISLRNTGTANITFDSTNNRYVISQSSTTGAESFRPIESCTGLDDFIIEFDAFLLSNNSYSFIGLCLYKDSSNWGRLGAKKQLNSGLAEYGQNINGTYSESDIIGSSIATNTWLHFKFEISDNKIHRQVYNGTTLLFEETRTYDSSWFTSTTKYGIDMLWTNEWDAYFKNLKVKAL